MYLLSEHNLFCSALITPRTDAISFGIYYCTGIYHFARRYKESRLNWIREKDLIVPTFAHLFNLLKESNVRLLLGIVQHVVSLQKSNDRNDCQAWRYIGAISNP